MYKYEFVNTVDTLNDVAAARSLTLTATNIDHVDFAL